MVYLKAKWRTGEDERFVCVYLCAELPECKTTSQCNLCILGIVCWYGTSLKRELRAAGPRQHGGLMQAPLWHEKEFEFRRGVLEAFVGHLLRH